MKSDWYDELQAMQTTVPGYYNKKMNVCRVYGNLLHSN